MSRYTEELIRHEAELAEIRHQAQDDQNFMFGIIVILAAVAGATFTLAILGLVALMIYIGAFSRGSLASLPPLVPVANDVAFAPSATPLLPVDTPAATATPTTDVPAAVAPGVGTPVAALPALGEPPVPSAEASATQPVPAADAPQPPPTVPPVEPAIPAPAATPAAPAAGPPPLEQATATPLPQPPLVPPPVVPLPDAAAQPSAVPPADTPTALPPAVLPPAVPEVPPSPTPAATFASGGLGLSRVEWEGMYGPAVDPAANPNRYGDPGNYTQDVSFVDDRLKAVIWQSEQPITAENALAVGSNYVPADGQYITSISPEGRPDTNVDLYVSQLLAARLGADSKWWGTGQPGTYLVQFTRTPTGVNSVAVSTGNVPLP